MKSKNKEQKPVPLSAEEEKKKKLEELFRPPVEIIFSGSFDEV